MNAVALSPTQAQHPRYGPLPNLDRAAAELRETRLAVARARRRLRVAKQDLFEWEVAHEDARRMLGLARAAAEERGAA